jgi:hypothetical protein
MTYDDHDLDALLRQPTERLAPPDGSWELVRRRARRRKWAKASASIAAGVIVAAGAVPAVIAVRHSTTNGKQGVQTLNQTPQQSPFQHPTNKTSPAPTSANPTISPSISLAGFVPESSSFISHSPGQEEGFLIGPGSKSAVVAKTTNGGQSWSAISSVPVNGAEVGIRFAHVLNGYVFGSSYYVTGDGGVTWQPEKSPGYIHDLETMNNQIWATVSKCQSCSPIQLWHGTVANPVLKPVTQVRAIPGDDSTLVLSSNAVYLMVQDKGTQQGQLWANRNGSPSGWVKRVDPCSSDPVGTFATWSINGLAALCDQVTDGSKPAQVLRSFDSGQTWHVVKGQVPDVGGSDQIAAGSRYDLIVSPGGFNGEPYVSTNAGKSFSTVHTGTASTGFVGFISPLQVVAISSPAGTDRTFLYSDNAGKDWTAYPFR